MKSIAIKPSDRRLLLGYAPGVFLALAFLMMSLLVPSVAPQGDTAAAGSPEGTVPGLDSPGAVPGTPVAPGKTPTKTGGGQRTSTAPGNNGVASGGGAGHVGGCQGKQVKGDSYSPPCVSFSGSNGGKTYAGVTAKTITVTYRNPSDSANATAAVQQMAGKYNSATFSDTPEQTERTFKDLAEYFSRNFQLYGRKLVLKPFDGKGLLLQEVLGAGQSGANADALTAARTYGAFADVSATTQPYAEALAKQHVVNIGAAYMSDQWFDSHAPYSWSNYPSCSDLAREAAAIVVKQMRKQSVTWAGKGVQNGTRRKYALLVPDNPVYQQCASEVASAMKKASIPVALNLSYPLDLAQMSSAATSVGQKLVSNKITTVIFGGDPIMMVYLTGDLNNADYMPEFLNIGAGYTDQDVVAQLFDQETYAHAAGVTNNGQIPAYGSSPGYFAVKSVDPKFAPAHLVDTYYSAMYMLALGIQQAGPTLTPTTFAKGMFNYGGGTGLYGPWTFRRSGRGVFTPQHSFRYEWWNPKGTSSFNNQPGTWVAGNKFYDVNMVPAGPVPVFPNGPQ